MFGFSCENTNGFEVAKWKRKEFSLGPGFEPDPPALRPGALLTESLRRTFGPNWNVFPSSIRLLLSRTDLIVFLLFLSGQADFSSILICSSLLHCES